MNNAERLKKWTYEVKEGKKGFECFIPDKDGNMCLYQNKAVIKLDSFSLMLWCNNQLTYHFVAGRNDDKPYIIIKGTNKMLFMEENQTTYIAKMIAQGKTNKLPVTADFNMDGIVNVRDAAAIARSLASKH